MLKASRAIFDGWKIHGLSQNVETYPHTFGGNEEPLGTLNEMVHAELCGGDNEMMDPREEEGFWRGGESVSFQLAKAVPPDTATATTPLRQREHT